MSAYSSRWASTSARAAVGCGLGLGCLLPRLLGAPPGAVVGLGGLGRGVAGALEREVGPDQVGLDGRDVTALGGRLPLAPPRRRPRSARRRPSSANAAPCPHPAPVRRRARRRSPSATSYDVAQRRVAAVERRARGFPSRSRGPCDFPIARATRGTLVNFRHTGNTFPNFFTFARRVDLRTTRMSFSRRPVVRIKKLLDRRAGREPVLYGRTRPVGRAQSASTGTWEVVEVGWEASPCRSNFCPLASPPSQKEKRAMTTPARSSAM